VLTSRIRLVKKLARYLNGVDLTSLKVGECVNLPDSVARMLLAEGWAELVNGDAATNGSKEDGTPRPACEE
jgi:hypothetical protein